MYNPKHFKSNDTQEAFDLMDRFPFATLITVDNGTPLISHLPLTPIKVNEQIELIGHIAKANPHWKALAQGTSTAIFHGPHTYITPKWYAENDVPTWNYISVHVQGQIGLMQDYSDLIYCLKQLSSHAEKHWPSSWDFYTPDDLSGERLTKSIVGFKIKVSEINFKKKLSQNRNLEDRSGVMKGLEGRSDDNSKGVLSAMQKLSQ